MNQTGYLFLGLTAIVAALAGVLAFAVARFFAAARAAATSTRQDGAETAFMAAAIEEAVGKVNDQLDTSEGPDGIWSGLIPARLDFGPPVPDERTAMEGLQPEHHLAAYTRIRT